MCQRISKEHAPKITFPVDGMEYIVDRNLEDKLQLTCEVTNEVKNVYWYLNDQFFCKAMPDAKTFFKPQPGAYKISCTDDKGRTAHIRITVKK